MVIKLKLSERWKEYLGGLWTQQDENFIIELEAYEDRMAKVRKVVKDMESNNFNDLSEFCFFYTQELKKAMGGE